MPKKTGESPLRNPEVNQRLLLFFHNQVRRLDVASMQLLKEKFRERDVKTLWHTVFSFLYSIEDSCGSIEVLAKGLKARDCYVISRMLLELIVNTCFILARGVDAARRAEQHLLQKSYRDLERKVSVGKRTISIKWQGKDDLPLAPELKAALDRFTSAKGTEIRDWTDENIVRRLEAIDEKFGHDVSSLLQLAYLAIYRNASEIAHGTLFGVHFAFGLTQPSGTLASDGHRKQFMEWTSLLLFSLGHCLLSLLLALGQYTNIKHLIEQAQQERKQIAELCGWIQKSEQSAWSVTH